MSRRPRRSARRLWWEFRANFADCSRWLESWFVPWRWVAGSHRSMVELRREVIS